MAPVFRNLNISGLKVKDSKFIPTDSNQVLSLLKKLNKSKGAGPDGISSQLILLIVLI